MKRIRLFTVALAVTMLSPVNMSAAAADSEPPQVAVDLEPGAEVSSPVRLTGTASDNVAVDRVRVSIRDRDTGKWLQPNGRFRADEHRFYATLTPTGNGTVSWSWRRALPNGEYHANIRVADTSGNYGAIDKWLAFGVTGGADREAPQIETDLRPGQSFSGRVTITGTASDNTGVTRVRVGIRDRVTRKWLRPNGTFQDEVFRLWAEVEPVGDKNVDWSLSVDLPAGSYVANIRARDAARNRTTLRPTINFTVEGSQNSVILAAAGDVARCGTDGDDQTADLLDDIFSDRNGKVAMLGDGAYSNGTANEYRNCYDPTWGRHKNRTRPVPGNHDYHTRDAGGYFGYFGSAAGDPDEGYYAYNLGGWRAIAINTECENIGGCGVGSAQYKWLKAELADHPRQCIVAYGHQPRYTSGPHGDSNELAPMWKLLYNAGADIALAGHSHNYQRYAKMDEAGNRDSNGLRSFVVGTAGASLRDMEESRDHLRASVEGHHGVLVLKLKSNSYKWDFISVDGKSRDSGTGNCD